MNERHKKFYAQLKTCISPDLYGYNMQVKRSRKRGCGDEKE
jgi:hypothetical protein